jgi:hypothetical protein
VTPTPIPAFAPAERPWWDWEAGCVCEPAGEILVEELEVDVEVEEGWVGIEDEEDVVELEEVRGVVEEIEVVKSCADEDGLTVPVSETNELVRVFAAAQAARLNPWFRPLVEFLGITRMRKNCTFGQHVVPPLAPLAQ